MDQDTEASLTITPSVKNVLADVRLSMSSKGVVSLSTSRNERVPIATADDSAVRGLSSGPKKKVCLIEKTVNPEELE